MAGRISGRAFYFPPAMGPHFLSKGAEEAKRHSRPRRKRDPGVAPGVILLVSGIVGVFFSDMMVFSFFEKFDMPMILNTSAVQRFSGFTMWKKINNAALAATACHAEEGGDSIDCAGIHGKTITDVVRMINEIKVIVIPASAGMTVGYRKKNLFFYAFSFFAKVAMRSP
jgi:hypothetical protein